MDAKPKMAKDRKKLEGEECFDKETCEVFKSGPDPFIFPDVHFTRESAESMAINNVAGGAVIIAGSGMCNGGRIKHHLKHNLWGTKQHRYLCWICGLWHISTSC